MQVKLGFEHIPLHFVTDVYNPNKNSLYFELVVNFRGMFFINFREAPAKKTDVLKLDMSGRFALNIVDNLIVVHHQASKVKFHCNLAISVIIFNIF